MIMKKFEIESTLVLTRSKKNLCINKRVSAINIKTNRIQTHETCYKSSKAERNYLDSNALINLEDRSTKIIIFLNSATHWRVSFIPWVPLRRTKSFLIYTKFLCQLLSNAILTGVSWVLIMPFRFLLVAGDSLLFVTTRRLYPSVQLRYRGSADKASSIKFSQGSLASYWLAPWKSEI